MIEQKPKIFLSYAHEDIGMAKRIYQDLKRRGLDVWFEKESLLPGLNIDFEIEKAIEESDYFLAVLSSKSIDKVGYIQKEVKIAIEKSKKYPKGKSYIIPIRLNDCKPRDKEIKEIYWIDVFPESEYRNGLKKILQVVSQGKALLRDRPAKLYRSDVNNMILRLDFFDQRINPQGKEFPHDYEKLVLKCDKVIFDDWTGLMWQQSGSSKMAVEEPKKNIDKLNLKGFAGFNNWRLPTLEEAMSLMEPERNNDRHINPIFDNEQYWIWTADQVQEESWAAWVVNFDGGYCDWDSFLSGGHVLAVRSAQSTQ